MKLKAMTLSCAAAVLSVSGVAHASSVANGTVYCDISSTYAAAAPTMSQLPNAISTSGGECATFTSNSITFASGGDYGSTSGTLAGFLNFQTGNIQSSTYYATAAANGGSGSTNTGSQSQDGSLVVLTGYTYLTTGEQITLSHDDGALIYFNGLLISPAGSQNQTTAGQSPFTYTGATGTGAYTLIYTSNYLPPAALISSINITPEPSSLLLMSTGLMSVAGMAFRKRSKP